MARKSDEIADYDMGTTSGEHATVGIVKKTREARDPCNNPELASTLPMCQKRESQAPVAPSRGPRDDIYGPSGMSRDGEQDTLD